MTVDDAIRYLAEYANKEALALSERELLAVAEGLLDLVRQGATIYMDSAAIEADLYGTPAADAAPETRPRPSDALKSSDQAALQSTFNRYGITNVQIFGSVAKGTDQPGSDLDLLITTPERFSLFTMIDLADDLEALLGVPVDLVTNDPRNHSDTMDAIRAAAIPLVEVLGHLHDSVNADAVAPSEATVDADGTIDTEAID